jgi:hypothetical protein
LSEASDLPIGRVGVARAGEHRGRFVRVEADKSGTGWHIWVMADDPRAGPSAGWDIWADEPRHVDEWLGKDELDVEWID